MFYSRAPEHVFLAFGFHGAACPKQRRDISFWRFHAQGLGQAHGVVVRHGVEFQGHRLADGHTGFGKSLVDLRRLGDEVYAGAVEYGGTAHQIEWSVVVDGYIEVSAIYASCEVIDAHWRRHQRGAQVGLFHDLSQGAQTLYLLGHAQKVGIVEVVRLFHMLGSSFIEQIV